MDELPLDQAILRHAVASSTRAVELRLSADIYFELHLFVAPRLNSYHDAKLDYVHTVLHKTAAVPLNSTSFISSWLLPFGYHTFSH